MAGDGTGEHPEVGVGHMFTYPPQELRELREIAGMLNHHVNVRTNHCVCVCVCVYSFSVTQTQSPLTDQLEERVSRAQENTTGGRYAILQVSIPDLSCDNHMTSTTPVIEG